MLPNINDRSPHTSIGVPSAFLDHVNGSEFHAAHPEHLVMRCTLHGFREVAPKGKLEARRLMHGSGDAIVSDRAYADGSARVMAHGQIAVQTLYRMLATPNPQPKYSARSPIKTDFTLTQHGIKSSKCSGLLAFIRHAREAWNYTIEDGQALNEFAIARHMGMTVVIHTNTTIKIDGAASLAFIAQLRPLIDEGGRAYVA